MIRHKTSWPIITLTLIGCQSGDSEPPASGTEPQVMEVDRETQHEHIQNLSDDLPEETRRSSPPVTTGTQSEPAFSASMPTNWEELYSEAERTIMGVDGKLVVPEKPDPPTDEEIRLGCLRAVAGNTGRITDSHTVQFEMKGSIGLRRVDTDQNFWHFRETTSEKVYSRGDNNPASFFIRYSTVMTIDGGEGSTPSFGALALYRSPIFASRYSFSSESTSYKDRFALTEIGWLNLTLYQIIWQTDVAASGRSLRDAGVEGRISGLKVVTPDWTDPYGEGSRIGLSP